MFIVDGSIIGFQDREVARNVMGNINTEENIGESIPILERIA